MITYHRSQKHEEYLRKKRNRKAIKYSVTIFLSILLVGLISYLLYRPAILVSDVVVTGNTILNKDDLKKVSLDYMEGSYFWLIPKNNIFWYPKKSLKKYLLEKYKRIETIDIKYKNFHTIGLSIKDRDPSFLWCQTEEVEECYFMDKNGLVFDRAPDFSGDAYLKIYGHLTNSDPVGQYYLSEITDFYELNDFIKKVRELKIEPKSLIGKGNGEYDLELSNDSEIYFDTTESLNTVYDNLRALLATTELSQSSPQNLPVEYIDLRFGNKLFYKIRNN